MPRRQRKPKPKPKLDRDEIFNMIPGISSLTEQQKERALHNLMGQNVEAECICSSQLHKAIHRLTDPRYSHNHINVEEDCSYMGSLAYIKNIVRSEPGGDAVDECCRTALYIAVQRGDIELVTLLLDEGKSNPNLLSLAKARGQINSNNPILLATTLGDEAMVEVLLLHGANRSVVASNGDSPLHIAVKKPDREYSKEMVRLLLQPNDTPSLNEVLDIQDAQGDKPIHAAVEIGYISAIELIVRVGNGDINARNRKGETPLIKAIRREHISKNLIVSLLKNLRADPNLPDQDGNCPLHLSISGKPKVSNNWLINKLILAGADPNRLSGQGFAPLLAAITANYPFAADRLLDAGADPELGDRYDNTPLFHLIQVTSNPLMPSRRSSRRNSSFSPFPVVLLLDGGASINKINANEGLSAFHKVVIDGDVDFLIRFLRYDSNMTLPNEKGQTAMDLAVESRRIDSIAVLLLAEYPVTQDHRRKIKALIESTEPTALSPYTGYLATERRMVFDGNISIIYPDFLATAPREIEAIVGNGDGCDPVRNHEVLKWHAGAVRWIRDELNRPLSLKRLCRRSLRKRLTTAETVMDSSLEDGLEEFLNYGSLREDLQSMVKFAPKTEELAGAQGDGLSRGYFLDKITWE